MIKVKKKFGSFKLFLKSCTIFQFTRGCRVFIDNMFVVDYPSNNILNRHIIRDTLFHGGGSKYEITYH